MRARAHTLRRYAFAAATMLCSLAFADLARADLWQLQSDTSEARVSGFAIPGIGITLRCLNRASAGSYNAMEFYLGQDYPIGPVTFQGDHRAVVTAIFPDGPLVADSDENVRLFNDLVQMFKQASSLTVTDFGGNATTVSLEGADQAIGDCVAGSGRAEGTSDARPSFEKTQLEGGIVFHRMDLDACPFEKGLAVANYHFRKTNAPREIQLTHVCIDRETGALWASEEEFGATLVERDEIQDRFEVLVDGLAPYARSRISLGTYDQGSEFEVSTASFSYNRPSTRQDGWAHSGTQVDGDVKLYGFVFKEDPVRDFEGAAFNISVTGSDHWDYRRCQFDCSRRTPYMYYEGMALVSGDGQPSSTDLTLGHKDGGTGGGQLTLQISESGVVSGSGTLRQENGTLAGLVNEDWKISEWQIHSIVGYVLGEGGQEIRATGFATGVTIDQDGYRNDVYASIHIQGATADVVEQWGEPEKADALRRLDGTEQSSKAREVEQLLLDLGFDVGAVDGLLDAKEREAIQEFQTKYDLTHTYPVPETHITLMRALSEAQ
ncbi:MAG: peptidoglycan-binding domain-containing protein [Pseudomonadota bacterium]